MNIPFLDLNAQITPHKENLLNLISKVIDKTAFASGSFVEEFENNFAIFNNSKYCVGVNSGTSALHLALLALDIKSGDEVILPSHTFIATVWAVTYVGATPVFVDVDKDYYTINPSLIEEKITSKTKAIIPVHLYGQAAELSPIIELCEKYNLHLIEDASQAHGTKYTHKGHDYNVGTLGDIGTFSFYPGKNLGAFGEGGGIVTNNEVIAKRISSLRNHAQTERYVHNEIGYNYRMDGIQGAVLNYKLQYLSEWNNKRFEIAKKYNYGFNNLKNISTPKLNPNSTHIFHLYELKLETKELRSNLINYLNSKNINTGLHYPLPIHKQEPYLYLKYGDTLPITDNLADTLLSLPVYAELTDEQVNYVISNIQDWANTI